MAGDKSMKMKSRTSQPRMPPSQSEKRQKLNIILVLNDIYARKQSITMQMEEKPIRNAASLF